MSQNRDLGRVEGRLDEIKDLQQRTLDRLDIMDSRISKLEAFKSKVTGVLCFITTIPTFIVLWMKGKS